MTATNEAVKCRCGMRMIPTNRGVLICQNCDQVQSQEAFSMGRRKTKQDIRFDMYWLQVVNNEYVDNTTQGEAPTEGEGETNGD